MPMTPSCSVVVRCFNEERHIARLLESIRAQTLGEVEVIVVDSGSTDNTVGVAQRYAVVLAHIAPKEFSFGRSLNLGCRLASAELIVLASAHVYPTASDWLERLLAPFADQRVAMVYGKQRGSELSKYSERQVFAAWFPDTATRGPRDYFCNNANAAIRRSVWEQTRYDESLTGLEDIAWAKAVKALGHEVRYEPNASVVHIHEETPLRIFRRYLREAMALKEIFPLEQFSFADFVRLGVANIYSDATRALREGVLLRNLSGIAAFRAMQFWGTYRGFHRRRPATSRLKRTLYYPRGWHEQDPDAVTSDSSTPMSYPRDAEERDGNTR
jgi:rhamnosyltransferase